MTPTALAGAASALSLRQLPVLGADMERSDAAVATCPDVDVASSGAELVAVSPCEGVGQMASSVLRFSDTREGPAPAGAIESSEHKRQCPIPDYDPVRLPQKELRRGVAVWHESYGFGVVRSVDMKDAGTPFRFEFNTAKGVQHIRMSRNSALKRLWFHPARFLWLHDERSIFWIRFDHVVLAMIGVNCVVMALEDPLCNLVPVDGKVCFPMCAALDYSVEAAYHDHSCSKELLWAVTVVETALQFFFTLDCAFRFVVFGPRLFLASRGSKVDTFIILLGWVTYVPGVPNVAILRSVRLLRPLRTMTKVRQCRHSHCASLHTQTRSHTDMPRTRTRALSHIRRHSDTHTGA